MYTTQALISRHLKRDLSDEESALLTASIIPATKLWIDRKLGTTFDDAEETSRLYEAEGNLIDIDGCVSITGVAHIDQYGDVITDYTADQYITEPENKDVKTQIVMRWGGAYCDDYYSRYRRYPKIKVTAKFTEYAGKVPEDIQVIATRIAAGMLNNTAKVDDEGNAIKSESIEGHTIVYGNPNLKAGQTVDEVAMGDPVVKSMLDLRREIYCG